MVAFYAFGFILTTVSSMSPLIWIQPASERAFSFSALDFRRANLLVADFRLFSQSPLVIATVYLWSSREVPLAATMNDRARSSTFGLLASPSIYGACASRPTVFRLRIITLPLSG